jgi:hypothetical protein
MTIAIQEKKTKQAANYRKGSVRQRCGLCVHYRPKPGACELVRGLIEPSALCDLYEPKKAARAA